MFPLEIFEVCFNWPDRVEGVDLVRGQHVCITLYGSGLGNLLVFGKFAQVKEDPVGFFAVKEALHGRPFHLHDTGIGSASACTYWSFGFLRKFIFNFGDINFALFNVFPYDFGWVSWIN